MNPVSEYTILIVDDQVANLDVLSNLLESRGFEVMIARESEMALQIVRRAQPDLILLDVILPEMDGFEICRRLKTDQLTEHIPIIFMTVLEKIEDKIRGFQLGAADYITKPFQAEEVLARVTTQLRLRSLTRELQEANALLEQRVAERTAQLTQVNEDLQAAVVERKAAEKAWRESEARWRSLTENSPDHILTLNRELNIEFANYASPGLTVEELIGTPLYTYVAEDRQNEIKALHEQVLKTGQPASYETEYDTPDGHVIYYESRVVPRLLHGEVIGLTVSARDITARKQAEETLHRVNRELQAISLCNQTLLRAVDEPTLLNEICRIICDEAGYRLAWVGYAEHDNAKTVRPMAWAGFDSGYIANAQLTWADNSERGRGPAGKVIRSGEIIYVQDFITDPQMAPWRENALQRGYRSGIALPLKDDSAETFGVLLIYAAEPNAITPDEIRLMDELASDLAFGITALRTRAERQRVEADLRKLSHAVEQSPASVVITDTAGTIEYVNPKFTQLTGYTFDEALGQNPRILKSGHTPPEEYKHLWDTITSGREWRGEFLNKKKNGEFYWEIASISRVRDATGTTTHFVAVKEDITERKQAEEALQDQYSTLRGIIDSTHALIFSVDRQYRYTSFNQRHVTAMQTLYGAEIELGHSLLDYMTVAEDRETARRNIDRALAGEQLVEEAYSGEEPRSRRYFHISHSPIQVETGDIIGVAVLAQDITERRWAEEALLESEKQFRLLAENSTDMISLHAPDGTYLYVSPACKTLLGYEPDELVGQSAYELFHPADVAAIRQSHATIMDHLVTYTVQYRIRRKAGNYLWFETTSKTIHDNQNEAVQEIQAASRDITARKRAETAEREQRLLATALVDTAKAINSTLDFDEVLERLLDAIKDVVPHDGANIMLLDEERTALAVVCSCDCYLANGLEKPDADVWQLIQSPDLQQMIDTHEALLIPNTLEYAGWSMKTNPNLIHSYIGMPIIIGGEVIGILNIDSITPDFFAEQHVERLQGFAHQAAIALQNAQLFQQLESYSADLEQAVIERTLELTRANTELQKLSQAKDEFVSNVSHELKSPITTLALRHHLLRTHPEDIEKHVGVLERETARLGRTIEDLLRLSRLDQERTEVVLAPVDLNVVAEHLVYDRGLQAQQKGLSLTFVGQPDLPVILADQGLLEQVLSILLTNAIHYTPTEGQISVFTQMESWDAAYWVGFGVSDTGLGIPLEEQPRLFERFFQGSANRQSGVPGTGLGLAIAQEIVDRHHGRIEVESTGIPGEGTTFRVWLPHAAEEHDTPTGGNNELAIQEASDSSGLAKGIKGKKTGYCQQ